MSPFLSSLIEAASSPYQAGGLIAWRFTKGKLQGDPVFPLLLRRGLIPSQARLLDLGCGKALLASWMFEARHRFEKGQWPPDWPEAPSLASYRGIEWSPSDVRLAQQALQNRAEILQGDIRATEFGPAEVVVILDVLHYMDFAAQDEVLARVYDTLPPGGVLLLRVGNASGGLQFKVSTWVDQVIHFFRNLRVTRLYCRATEAWRTRLTEIGFSVEEVPLSQGATFSNVFFRARREH